MAYDVATSQLILFGGFAAGILNDTWVWNGRAWQQVADASDPGCTTTCTSGPSVRGYANMAYDAATSQLVLFGGRSPERGDTWIWNGSGWTELFPAVSPVARDSAAMAYDPESQSLVLFGGDDGTHILNDTWTWNGSTWTQVDDSPPGCTNNCASSPPARQLATMASNPVSGGGVALFGGETGNNVSSNLNDTWTWNGSTWTQVDDSPPGCTNNCASSPSARQAPAMVYDAAPGVGVSLLFGGIDVTSSELGDTWTWDPTNGWVELAPSTSPTARDTPSLAYDGATAQPVMFGGEDASLNDTWTYGPAATTTTVTTSVNPSVLGQTVTFTATVTAATGTFDDGGSVQFAVDGSNLGSPQSLSGGGTAGITATGLAAGNHVITATYSGDGAFYGSTGTLSGGQRVGTSGTGYWLVGGDGGVFTFGTAQFYGSEALHPLNAPVSGIAATPGDGGYWLVAGDGGVFTFGDAQYYGSEATQHLNAPVIGMAATPDGKGYWEAAEDGGVFTFGDAQYYGSEATQHLNAPVVGIAATPDGLGYWLVATDGGVFAFGDAQFYGSEALHPLNAPVTGMAATPDGLGYWLVAADGGVFTFGTAQFYGSQALHSLNAPVSGIAVTRDGLGYRLVATDGGVFTFGDAQFAGSMALQHLNALMVGITSSG